MKYDFFNYLSRTELWIVGSAVVAFLVGIWVLRGAPPGQTGEAEGDDDAPRAGYRDRIVVAVVVGLILILGGGYAALSRGILWSLPIFAVGFGLVLALIAFNRRYRHASPSLRRTIDFSIPPSMNVLCTQPRPLWMLASVALGCPPHGGDTVP